jgi:uncharacterized coiled-coil protein SlyX
MNGSISTAVRVLALTAVTICLAVIPARAVSPPPDGDYGSGVTAEGNGALFSLSGGVWDTAIGYQTLYNNTTGFSNTATGVRALFNNIGGNKNTAAGVYALYNITSGSNNIGIGYFAGLNLTTESNVIAIGSPGEAGEENYIRIGTEGVHTETYIAGIFGVPVEGSGDPVCVNDEGQLGECGVSSARFKHDIQSMDKTSESIFALRPVTFHYNAELHPNSQLEFGLVAEEVAKVDPHLVKYDKDGKIFGVRYEAVNAMMLNEFLKEHRTIEQLQATVAKQEAIIAQQQKSMEAFAANLKDQQAQIQKVSAQVTVSKPAPQVVTNQ